MEGNKSERKREEGWSQCHCIFLTPVTAPAMPGFKGGTLSWVTERNQGGGKREKRGKRNASCPSLPGFFSLVSWETGL